MIVRRYQKNVNDLFQIFRRRIVEEAQKTGNVQQERRKEKGSEKVVSSYPGTLWVVYTICSRGKGTAGARGH
jgi:hypothetical protein